MKQDSSMNYNVLILNCVDSSFVKGDVFNSTSFTINNIETSPFLIKVMAIGYSDTILKIVSNENYIDLGTIKMKKEDELGEVSVVHKRPVFERKDGNTRVNVENTLLGSTTSVLELLSKTPSVKVGENVISVFGKGEAVVYLNGREITFERLNTIPINRIVKIEIITNPSAKYDAKGKAVVNIITKINTEEGINGQIIETLTQGKYLLNTTAFNLNYKKNKISIFTDYSFETGHDWNKGYSDKTIQSQNKVFKSHNDNLEKTRLTNISNYRLGIDYNINSHSDLSVQYDGLYNRFDLNLLSQTSMKELQSESTTYLDALNHGLTLDINNSVNLNYNNTLDTLGSSLFIGGQYCDYSSKLYDQIDEKIYFNDTLFNRAERINDGSTHIQLFTSQIDYSKIFKNSSKIELGTKYSFVNNDGSVKFKSKNENETNWISYPQFSNSFIYTESVPAVYVQYSKTFMKKYDFSIGVRSEYSNVYGFSRAYNQKAIDTSYLNLFPSMKLIYKKSDQFSLILSFSSKINRPNYQRIDPFVWYNDSLTSTQGNSKLIPEKSYSSELQFLYNIYSFKIGYTYALHPIKGLPIVGKNGPNSIIYSTFNLKTSNQVYTSLEIPIEKTKFYSYNIFNFSYEKLSAFNSSIANLSVSPQLYFYTYNQIKLIKAINFDVSGEYSTPYSDGLYKYRPFYSLGFGFSRKFLNKKLSTRLMVNDVFKTYYEARSSKIGQIETSSYKKLNTFFIRLSVVYRFGKLKESGYKNKVINEEELKRVK